MGNWRVSSKATPVFSTLAYLNREMEVNLFQTYGLTAAVKEKCAVAQAG